MYRIVWEFEARPEQLEQFLEVYGADGLWTKFFRNSTEYRGTELFSSTGQTTRFVTIDSWQSRAAYESFRRSYGAEYGQLDTWCERLLKHERTLGVSDDGKD
jgi:quinol monooxygenase YgiN